MTSRLDTQSVLRRLSAFVATAKVRYDTDGSIVVDGRLSLDMSTRNEIRSTNAASGAFDSRWLRLASLHDMSWLLDKNGLPHDVACIRINGDMRTLADAILWEWIEHGLIRFVPVGSLRSKPSSTRRHIGKFCVALVSNYPELFLRPLELNTLDAYTSNAHQHHDWSLTECKSRMRYFDAGMLYETTMVESMRCCDVAATATRKSKAPFRAHPALTRLVVIRSGKRRWLPPRRATMKVVMAEANQDGVRLVIASAGNKAHEVIANGADMVDWVDIRKIRGLLPTEALSFYRLKSNRPPLWNRVANNLSCPNPSCSNVEFAPASHVWWTCPRAQQHWQQFREAWRSFGLNDWTGDNFWIFGLELPDRPQQATSAVRCLLPGTSVPDNLSSQVATVSDELWRFTVAVTVHAIWLERLRRMEDPTCSDATHSLLAESHLRKCLIGLMKAGFIASNNDFEISGSVRIACARLLLQNVKEPALQRAPPNRPDRVHVLFFDGGSRGNPGPGGSGSVVITLEIATHSASVTWATSMAYGSNKTTNNTTEYQGLIHGLRWASTNRVSSLHVVGDSAMIIAQLRQRRPPHKAHLVRLYHKARTLADEINVASWTHHYRCHNKMADLAANVAMDSCTSVQSEFTELNKHLNNDINHWIETATEADERGPNVLATSIKNSAVVARQIRQRAEVLGSGTNA